MASLLQRDSDDDFEESTRVPVEPISKQIDTMVARAVAPEPANSSGALSYNSLIK